MKCIYNAGFIPELHFEDNENSDFYGWLFFKHPDGQLVTCADLKAQGIFTPYTEDR